MKVSDRVAFILLLAATPSLLLADTVFRLDALGGGEAGQSGFATLVAENTVITSFGLIEQGDQWVVLDHTNGARLVTSLVSSDEANDLALLRVPGLLGEPARFALEEGATGRNVFLQLIDEARPGTLHSVIESANEPARVRHTALIQQGEFAAPLANNCLEVIGINQSDRASFLNSRLEADAEFGYVGQLAALKTFLTANEISFLVADGVCLSEAEQLLLAQAEALERQQEMERLQAEQVALEAEREELRLAQEEAARRNEELAQEAQDRLEELEARQAELDEALSEIESAEEDVSTLEEEISQREQVLQEARLEQERQRQQQLYIILGSAFAGAILLALLAFQIRRRQTLKQQSEQEIQSEKARVQTAQAALAKASATFPDILLTGKDDAGHDVRLKLNGNALIRSDNGQIVGRSAQQADYVLNLEHVSRQHLRISIRDEAVYVEDMSTLNGSAVNGRVLTPNSTVRLEDADELRIGLQTFSVKIMRHQSE